MGLDLYARVESLLGFEQDIEKLHNLYVNLLLKDLPNKGKVLDVGCGAGALGVKLKDAGFDVIGIDLSSAMVERAQKAGIQAYNSQIENFNQYDFDAITAVFDVLNYIPKDSLYIFLQGIADRLKTNGLFFADINTLHGFSDIAPGVLSANSDMRTAIVEADFENNTLTTKFTLFTKNNANLYQKEEGYIEQFYHAAKEIESFNNLKWLKKQNVRLFSENPDKYILKAVKI